MERLRLEGEARLGERLFQLLVFELEGGASRPSEPHVVCALRGAVVARAGGVELLLRAAGVADQDQRLR